MKIDFTIHNTLNPTFWDGFNLKPEIRKKLLETALEFHKFLKIDAPIKDVILTGSASNFNYSKKYSDLDLHVLYKFTDVLSEDDEDDEKIETKDDLVDEYLNAKKTIWNEKYNITIKGSDVELYAQDVKEEHVSSGTFSVANNKWIKKPEKTDVKMDLKSVSKKAKQLMSQIDAVIKQDKPADPIKDKLKKFRQAGLDSSDGEFSVENLTFKVLRRIGYIDKLYDYAVDSKVDDLSVK